MKLQKLCCPLGISNDHNVTRAILNDTVSGKVILVLFRFSCKLSTLCSLKDQNRTKYLLLQNYMASSVSMILASTAQQVMCMFSLHKKKKKKKHKKRDRKLEKPPCESQRCWLHGVLELVSSVTINITLDFTTCCKSSLQDHLGSLRARVESRHVRRA